MEETKEINTLEVIQEPKSTGIVPVTVAEYFNLLPDPEKGAQRADATKKMLASLCKAASPANIVNFGGKPFFDHIVVCYEKWILYNNWQQPAQWLN